MAAVVGISPTVGLSGEVVPLRDVSSGSVDAQSMRFAETMERQRAAAPGGGENVRVAQADGGNVVVDDPSLARERALRALGFEHVTPGQAAAQPGGALENTGDTILDGLMRLRGAFDEQAGALNKMHHGGMMSATEMLALQVEVVKYGMLIDVTSKLTGKSTQAFDTLLKGQ